MREAISPHERLSATIRFLVSGITYEELKFITAISPQRSHERALPNGRGAARWSFNCAFWSDHKSFGDFGAMARS
ncbi:unnamed protein product [Euphydryas editha]|uniref:Uncharacterized protein n=1 Tax=Euphydryas editha TaxID=104508 RepID=A0AAU9TZL2_EUPED|nr:unnamed protein product [Euphydryas editha]